MAEDLSCPLECEEPPGLKYETYRNKKIRQECEHGLLYCKEYSGSEKGRLRWGGGAQVWKEVHPFSEHPNFLTKSSLLDVGIYWDFPL